jgi:hypothetical protein
LSFSVGCDACFCSLLRRGRRIAGAVHPRLSRSVPEVQKIPGDRDSVKSGNLIQVPSRPAGTSTARWIAVQIARGEVINAEAMAQPGGGHEAWRKCLA